VTEELPWLTLAEAAYARGDLFVKRRKLMEEWASFLRCHC